MAVLNEIANSACDSLISECGTARVETVDEDVLGVYTQPVSGQAEALALSPEEAVLAKEAAAKMAVIAKEQTALVLR